MRCCALVIGPRERALVRSSTGAAGSARQAAVAPLYLPWLLYATPRLIPYVSQKVVADADRPLGPLVYVGRHLSAFLAGHLEGLLASYWPFALLLLFPLGVGVYHYWSRGFNRLPGAADEPPESSTPIVRVQLRTRHAIAMLLTVLITALALGWLIGFRFPFFPPRGERLLLIVLPAFLMLVAVGVDGLLRANRFAGIMTMGLIGAVAGASLTTFYLEPRYPQDDYRPLIARTVEQGLPDDTVFAVYPWQVGYWRSYGHPDGPTAILSPDSSVGRAGDGRAGRRVGARARVVPGAPGAGRHPRKPGRGVSGLQGDAVPERVVRRGYALSAWARRLRAMRLRAIRCCGRPSGWATPSSWRLCAGRANRSPRRTR